MLIRNPKFPRINLIRKSSRAPSKVCSRWAYRPDKLLSGFPFFSESLLLGWVSWWRYVGLRTVRTGDNWIGISSLGTGSGWTFETYYVGGQWNMRPSGRDCTWISLVWTGLQLLSSLPFWSESIPHSCWTRKGWLTGVALSLPSSPQERGCYRTHRGIESNYYDSTFL